MTVEEILKFTYCWCQDLDRAQIRHEMGVATNTGVDWDSFCRKVCEVTLFENSTRIGSTIVDIVLNASGCLAESRVRAENLFL